jgi:hypothetical protein
MWYLRQSLSKILFFFAEVHIMRFLKNVLSYLEKLIPIPKTLPPVSKEPNLATRFGCLLEMEKRKGRLLQQTQRSNKK